MNLKTILLSVLSIFLLTQVSAQSFEGVITMSGNQETGINASFTVKGDKVLMEAQTGEGQRPVRMISEKESGDMIILTEKSGKKIAVKMNMMAIQQSMPGAMKKQKDDNGATLKVTNETKTIDGYKCTKVIGENDESNYEAWVTKDLEFSLFDLFPMMKDARDYSSETDVIEKMFENGFIMEMTEKKKKDGKVSTMKTSVDEKKVDASIFNITEDEYDVFDMTDMAKLMQEAQKNPERMQQLQEIFNEMGGN